MKIVTIRTSLYAAGSAAALLLAGTTTAQRASDQYNQKQTEQRWKQDDEKTDRMYDPARLRQQDQKQRQMSDESIQKAAEREAKKASKVEDLTIQVSNGKATLKGNVDSFQKKRRIERVVETIRGIKSIDNNLNVKRDKQMTDQKLKQNVQEALNYEGDVDLQKLTVEVNNHVVTLKGNVDNYQAKKTAEEAVADLKGVQDVKNNVDIASKSHQRKQMDSKQKEQKVKDSLRNEALLKDEDVRVKVQDKDVVLTGEVASLAEKRKAEEAAYVEGVEKVVITDLKVKDRPNNQSRQMAKAQDQRKQQDWRGDKQDKQRQMAQSQKQSKKYQKRSDEEIKNAIQENFNQRPRLQDENLNVKVQDKKVILTGQVSSLKAKRQAETFAQNAIGVEKVENNLKVQSKKKTSGQDLKQQITKAFERDASISKDQINVEVKEQGTVVLSGTVDTYWDKAQADDLAARAEGVTDVRNNIQVKDTESRVAQRIYVDEEDWQNFDWYDFDAAEGTESDSELKEEIQEEFFWSPFIDGDSVNVKVNNGVVTLTGRVQSRSEIQAAIENAYEGGATDVKSQLEVVGDLNPDNWFDDDYDADDWQGEERAERRQERR